MKAKDVLIVILVTLALLIPLATATKLYSLRLAANDKGLAYSSTAVMDAEAPTVEEGGTYTIEVFDFSGEVLYQTTFTPLSFQTFDLKLPYFSNGKEIKITNSDGKSILIISTAYLTDTCGNEQCEDQENNKVCPSDCLSGGIDNYCDAIKDDVCDSDCKSGEDKDCHKFLPGTETMPETPPISEDQETFSKLDSKPALVKEEVSSTTGIPWWVFLLLFLLLFIIIVIILIIYDKHKHHQKRNQELSEYISSYLQAGYSNEQLKAGLLKYGYNEKEIEEAVFQIKTMRK